jgi:hypothetical protein
MKVRENRGRRRSGSTSRVPENIRYDRFGHMIVHTEQSLRCGQCEGRSRYMCEKCDVGLHPECFKTFHSH